MVKSMLEMVWIPLLAWHMLIIWRGIFFSISWWKGSEANKSFTYCLRWARCHLSCQIILWIIFAGLCYSLPRATGGLFSLYQHVLWAIWGVHDLFQRRTYFGMAPLAWNSSSISWNETFAKTEVSTLCWNLRLLQWFFCQFNKSQEREESIFEQASNSFQVKNFSNI